ncbi:MAG TPA: electron transport complex subunit E [Candidatus Faecaligallichristensenella faecipullorum]|nr:electron transport complex subunit E [Candidatus Faecaligallichristensenella faecipullorum]
MNLKKVFLNGILNENPTFRLVLGMCPTLAITTAAMNGVGMGLATTFVLVGSNLAISLMRNIIPERIRIPTFVVVIATFVTIVQMLIKAYVPALDASLGIYIPLIVVNCIIFARAESFAFKNKPLPALMDGLGMGLGFTLAITLLSSIRELIGNGTLFGVQIMAESYQPMAIATQAPGGFIVLGFLLALVGVITRKADRKSGKEGA